MVRSWQLPFLVVMDWTVEWRAPHRQITQLVAWTLLGAALALPGLWSAHLVLGSVHVAFLAAGVLARHATIDAPAATRLRALAAASAGHTLTSVALTGAPDSGSASYFAVSFALVVTLAAGHRWWSTAANLGLIWMSFAAFQEFGWVIGILLAIPLTILGAVLPLPHELEPWWALWSTHFAGVLTWTWVGCCAWLAAAASWSASGSVRYGSVWRWLTFGLAWP